MKQALLASFFGLLLFAPAAECRAQAPPQAPKPGPELKRLNYFAGKWRSEGEMKPGPFGPGGKFTESEDAEWMPGGFFLLIHSDEQTPMGNGKTLMILGYNSEKKVYTFNAFDSMGEAETATGTVEGGTWTWLSDSTLMGKQVKSRFTMKELSPTSYTTKFEMSSDGGGWTTIMEGKTTKISAKP